MVTLSILTPTYNRVGLLKRLYKSLQGQTNKDFEWIVIDDGSTDSTKQYIDEIINESDIHIKYICTHNGGKHRALNLGIEYTDSLISMCVDSDDWLPAYAVDTIIEAYHKQCKNDEVIGIVAKCGIFEGQRLKELTIINASVYTCTLFEFYDKYHCSGDTALIYKTSILKDHSFSEYENEKFISEDDLYYRLDSIGELFILNQIVYYVEYQSDGLSSRCRELLEDNPNGSAAVIFLHYKASNSFLKKMKYLGLGNYYSLLARKNYQLSDEIDYVFRRKISANLLGFMVRIYKRIF